MCYDGRTIQAERVATDEWAIMTEELLKPNDTLQGEQSQYAILNLVGRGGMGAVYRAKRLSDSTIWALKEMRPPANTSTQEVEDNRKLFEQEAELLKSLQHPNITKVVDTFEFEGRPVMVMEFIDGQTLEDLLHENKMKLDEQQIIEYGIQLCRVLGYLHTRKPPIIYRDLKPPNVMINSKGIMKLIDFGVARTYKEQKSKDTIAMGSAGYAPPEQYGKAQTDERSDIYALGATLLHMSTGVPPVPFQPPRPGDIRKYMATMKPKTERVIIKAMSLKREQRYKTCEEMEQALMECLDRPYVDPTESASGPAVVEEPPKQSAPPPQPLSPAQPQRSPMPQQPAAPAAPAAPADADTSGASCTHCGRLNKSGARFCAGCGMPLGSPPVARLLIRSPHGTWEMRLEQLPCRIGRRDPRQNHYPELDLANHDRGIASRHHAVINCADDVFSVTDLGSTNGTMLNDVRIPPHAAQQLRPGDRIKIGEVDMEFGWS